MLTCLFLILCVTRPWSVQLPPQVFSTPIQTVTYSMTLAEGLFARSAARAPNGTSVTIETDVAVAGSVRRVCTSPSPTATAGCWVREGSLPSGVRGAPPPAALRCLCVSGLCLCNSLRVCCQVTVTVDQSIRTL